MKNQKANLKVLLISPMWPSDLKPYYGIFVKKFKELLEKENVFVKALVNKNPGTGFLNAFIKYALLAEKVYFEKGSYHIVHGHFLFPGGYFAAKYANRKGIPAVVSAHGSDVYLWKKIFGGRTIYERIFSNAAKIIFPSAYLLETVKKEFENFPEEKAKIIPMGVSRDFYNIKTAKEKARKRLNIDTDKKVLLSVGELIDFKRMDTLIKAVADIENTGKENIDLIIVGTGKERKKLEKLSDSLNVEVLFKGAVERSGIKNYYAAADVFVSASRRESYGIALREAMAAGLPIIASDIPAFREAFSDGEAGLFFAPDDYRELSERIRTIIEDDKLKRQMAKRSREIAKNFSSDRFIGEVLKIYQDLV